MEGIEYFYELYTGLPRGGPGDNQSTRKAFSFLKDLPAEPYILDIGCGPGMQTLELARITSGKIVALDNYTPFLDVLKENAIKEELDKRIFPISQSMLEMGFKDESFDIIWSEGALYHMGFRNGLKKCHQILKEGGCLAVTEGVLLTSNSPPEAKKFWSEYPEVRDISGNIDRIPDEKYRLLTHFTLPKKAWIDNYYSPLENRIAELKKKYPNKKNALQVFERSEKEIELYKRNSDYVGYEFFVMQKK